MLKKTYTKTLFCFTFLHLLRDFVLQKQFSKRLLSTLPYPIHSNNTKTYFNYSIQITNCIAKLFCDFRGKKITVREKKTQTYLSFLAAIIDLEIDQKIKGIEELNQFLKNMKLESSPSLNNIYFLIQKIKNSSNEDYLKSLVKNCLLFQLDSLRQTNTISSVEELRNITWKKCGYSFLLSRMLLENSLLENEEDFCYQYGGIGQLGDDILDIYDDKGNEIQTFAHVLSNNELKDMYFKELKLLFDLLLKVEYRSSMSKKTVRKLCMVVSIPLIQLENLDENNVKTGKSFSIENTKRFDTVCDMQKMSNILKCFKQSINIYFSYYKKEK